ncbi:MerR family transcriptional regulator [Actinomycetospora endophytica]|uniref:MerR family transcriptional regulator n=1 Tax=Actinomycetospora endophytica TaxID=2291215 RepID=A0ABS8PGR8_9PSEU|nr:MerR family transcriptional regulator [Actinomycetospora endophytica]MCD2197442.1 MerR family transcriptional regulator [Actinomycetospora endophytica]
MARASGASLAQLTAWEGSGLVVPDVVSDDGYRAYGPDDLVRLRRVLLLRALGVPDDGIGAALDRTDDLATALRMHLDVLEAMRERLGRQVDGAAAQALAARHRGLTGPDVSPGVADALDRHGLGTAAYARDALAVAVG